MDCLVESFIVAEQLSEIAVWFCKLRIKPDCKPQVLFCFFCVISIVEEDASERVMQWGVARLFKQNGIQQFECGLMAFVVDKSICFFNVLVYPFNFFHNCK